MINRVYEAAQHTKVERQDMFFRSVVFEVDIGRQVTTLTPDCGTETSE